MISETSTDFCRFKHLTEDFKTPKKWQEHSESSKKSKSFDQRKENEDLLTKYIHYKFNSAKIASKIIAEQLPFYIVIYVIRTNHMPIRFNSSL